MYPFPKSLYRIFSTSLMIFALIGNCVGQQLQGEYSRMFNYWSQECYVFSEEGTFRHFVTNPGDSSFGCGRYRIEQNGQKLILQYTDSIFAGANECRMRSFPPVYSNKKVSFSGWVIDAYTGMPVSNAVISQIHPANSTTFCFTDSVGYFYKELDMQVGKEDTFDIVGEHTSYCFLLIDLSKSTEILFKVALPVHQAKRGKQEIYTISKRGEREIEIHKDGDGGEITTFAHRSPPNTHK